MEYGYLSRESVEHIDKIVAALLKNDFGDEDIRTLGFELIADYTDFISFRKYEDDCEPFESVEFLNKLYKENKERLKSLMASIFRFATARNYCMKLWMDTFNRRRKGMACKEHDLPLKEMTPLTTNGYRLNGIFWLSSGLIDNRGLPMELGFGIITESLFYIFDEDGIDLDEVLIDTYNYIVKNNQESRR